MYRTETMIDESRALECQARVFEVVCPSVMSIEQSARNYSRVPPAPLAARRAASIDLRRPRNLCAFN